MKKCITLLVLVITWSASYSQNSNQNVNEKEYPIIEALTDNSWTGTGQLMGQEATYHMDWQNVLDRKFIKLEFQNKRKSAGDEYIVFNATAYYKIVNDTTIVGQWFDNRGVTLPLKGSIKENELTILWGNDETEKGKTVYQYISHSNKISVIDFVMSNGTYAKFGSATYNIMN